MIFDTEVHTRAEFDELIEWVRQCGYAVVGPLDYRTNEDPPVQDHFAERAREELRAQREAAQQGV